jgi:hypothetical protein
MHKMKQRSPDQNGIVVLKLLLQPPELQARAAGLVHRVDQIVFNEFAVRSEIAQYRTPIAELLIRQRRLIRPEESWYEPPVSGSTPERQD